MYKLLLNSTSILRLSDGAIIPPDSENSDYVAYLEWVELGNTAEAADPAPPPTANQVEEGLALEYQPLVALATMTVAEINAYVDATFPTLNAQQREVLKILGLSSSVLLRRTFPQYLP